MMTSDGGMSHFGAVDETTKRLVQRCGKVGWLREEVGKRRFLGVEMPSAMGSSLSVMEVAAHTAKPGEQTPSRKEDAARDGDNSNGNGNGVLAQARGEVIGVERSPFEVEGDA